MKSIIVAFILILCLTPVYGRDDFQYWAWGSLTMVDTKHIDLITHGQVRYKEDAKDLGFYLISEKLKIDLFRHVSMGLNYTHIRIRNKVENSDQFKSTYQNRYEVEITPHWKTNHHVAFKNRTRVEFREIEGKGFDNTRIRYQWFAGYARLYSSAEIFYDFKAEKYNENRVVPLGYKLGFDDNSSFNLFYLFQSVKKSDSWATNQVLGTDFRYQF